MSTTTIRCYVTLTNGSAVVQLTAGNTGNNGISVAAPNVIEDMHMIMANPVNATRVIKGSLGTGSFELQEPWNGTTVTGAEVRICTSGSAVANLTAAVRDLIDQKEVAAADLLAAAPAAATATAQAVIATTKATEAAASAATASTSADTSTTKAADATTAAATATTAAATATTKAADATAAAGTATTASNTAVAAQNAVQTNATTIATTAANSAVATATATATTASAAASTARDLAIAAWGSAAAPAESLAAISQSVHSGAIVASFLYDTSKDSEAGQWRKKCADKSWYTEAIQTGAWRGQRASLADAWAISGAAVGDWYQSTADGLFYAIGGTSGAPTQTQIYRGNAREFPALALIIAETNRAVIYDASAPGCPMWMVFVTTASYTSLLGGTVYAPLTAIAAINGQLVIGSNGTTASGSFAASYLQGLKVVNFPNDSCEFHKFKEGYATPFINTVASGLSARNGAFFAASSVDQGANTYIVNFSINAAVVTVLPDAPIDPLTGLAVPTITVATAGGVSVIKHDGTVVNSAATTDRMYGASIDSKARLWAVGWDSGNIFEYPPVGTLSASFSAIKQYSTQSVPATIVGMGPTVKTVGQRYGAAAGFPVGMMLLRDNPAAPTKGMVSYITKDYAAGWMVGDIKRCLLADTVAETVVGATVLSDDFSSYADTAAMKSAGWASNPLYADITLVSSALRVTKVQGDAAGCRVITTVVGVTYAVIFKTLASSTVAAGLQVVNGTQQTITAWNLTALPAATTATYTCSFVATGTTTSLLFATFGGAVGGFIDIDDVYVKRSDPDRSVKAKPITVVGSLTKSPVASGAGLVAYSGFSASSYLEEVYSSDLDFGTGDFAFQWWCDPAAVGCVFSRGDGISAGSMFCNMSGSAINLYIHNGTSLINVISVAVSAGASLMTLCRTGSSVQAWQNSQLLVSVSSALTLTCANGKFRSGARQDTASGYAGWLTLLRAGATAPSADQIAHIYRTEKALFAAGAQCTLAGTSNAVTALAYDDETDTWHAGTSYGRTGFRDLLRVDSEVTTVGAVTSISAANGAVLLGGASSAKYYKPAFLLRDEIRRKAEARRALGKEPVFFDVDAVASQTAFTVQQGYTVKAVYSASTLKRLGSTKDYTVSTDGFRETVNFAVSPGAAAWVSIMAVRA